MGRIRVAGAVFLLLAGTALVAGTTGYVTAVCTESSDGVVGSDSCTSTAPFGVPTATLAGVFACIIGAALLWVERPLRDAVGSV